MVKTTVRNVRVCARKSGANVGQQTRWRHFYNFTPPIQSETQQTHNMFTHTDTYADGQRLIERETEGGERLTDLLPQFYLWSLSQQTNCITNRPIIQREKKRCWERERDAQTDIKRGMHLLPVGDKERKKGTFFPLQQEKPSPKLSMWQTFSKIFTPA